MCHNSSDILAQNAVFKAIGSEPTDVAAAAASSSISADKKAGVCPLNAPLEKHEMVILNLFGSGTNRIYLLKKRVSIVIMPTIMYKNKCINLC